MSIKIHRRDEKMINSLDMTPLTKEKIRTHLETRMAHEQCRTLSDLPDPFLFAGMRCATARIQHAIELHETITIVGDYDVDGVIATTILSDFFTHFGIAHHTIIPNRFTDGYGFSKSVLTRCHGSLIITVDNGIAAHETAYLCVQSGKDLIITDHHEPKDTLPPAYAIINPKQHSCPFPYKHICGAQVAWYLCAALKHTMKYTFDLSEYIELLTLSILADVMPLRDMNRCLVKKGLMQLRHSQRPAIQVLRSALNTQHFSTEDLTFFVIPRLNAAGRMGSAEVAKDFLLSPTIDQAFTIFQQLNSLNHQRKFVEKEVLSHAREKVRHTDQVIVVWGEEWHEGTIGIVASRLSEEYQKPAIVFSVSCAQAKGSARSDGSCDILALIATQSKLLSGFGGHKEAAGISMPADQLSTFQANLQHIKEHTRISSDAFHLTRTPLGILPYSEIDIELLEILEQHEPYGESAPKPLFLSPKSIVQSSRILGNEIHHTAYTLTDTLSHKTQKAIIFRKKHPLKPNDSIQFSFTLSRNTFQNRSFPQLIIQQILTS
jgi:single-stranded-DNA-specific exonuclease